MSFRIRKAVFPVAGLGTRFLPATKTVPKEMLPVVDKPLIQYAVDEAIEAGCDTMVFVTNRYKHSVADYFDKAYELEQKLEKAGKSELLSVIRDVLPRHVRAVFVTQAEALGLGHAVLCARPVVGDEPFAVLLPDDLIWNRGPGALKQMVELAGREQASVIAVQDVPAEQTASYGIVATSDFSGRHGAIQAIVEKPKPEVAPSTLAVVGRYVLSGRIFDLLEKTKPGAGGEIQLTDGIAALLKEQKALAYRFEGRRFDCGSRIGLVEATLQYALDHEDLSGPTKAFMRAALGDVIAGEANYYAATAAPAAAHPPLRGRSEARVCIIGGGFAGLNTALGLAERGMRDVVVLEAQSLAFGASGRNGGFVFGGFSRGEEALLADLGPDRARALYAGTQDAVNLIRRRIGFHGIACQSTDAGVLWANWFRDPQVLRRRQQLLSERFGTEWSWLPREQLCEQLRSDRYHDGLFEANALHFHPLNYARGLARVAAGQGVALHEQSPAIGLERDGAGWRVRTPGGEVRAEQVVLACGGYLAGLRSDVDAGVLPIATYVMVTEPLGARLDEAIRTRAAIYDSRFAFDYYRPLPDTRLLWGGRISVLDRSPEAVRKLLLRDLLKVYPQLTGVKVDYAWSGLMSYARHEMPQIGRIDQGLWLAQAFGGHGVAPTTFAGEVLASAIADGDMRWKEFADYGLVSALKPAGFLGAQLTYWWLETKDAWKAWREKIFATD